MKLDHGLFAAIRQRLLGNITLRNLKIYTLCPPDPQYPLIYLDLEEIWTCFSGAPVLEKRRIVFSITIALSAIQQSQQQVYTAKIIELLDGAGLRLDEGHRAMLRFIKSVSMEADKKGILKLQQHYEALVC